MAAAMRIVLIVAEDAVSRRLIADALMGAGYGVCETHSGDLVPAVPRLDAVVSSGELVRPDRFGAPIVPIARPLDMAGLLARVRDAITAPGERAA
jgi:CheY-like chemotaxis protein